MNIFWHELRSNQRSTFIWAISLSVLAILFLSLFPSFTKDIDASKKILEHLPLALREALGISLKNFFTIFGFFGYLFNFVVLAGAIQAMNLGVGAISKEDSGKTADFLLTKPVGRAKIITAKLLAALTSLILTNIVFITSAFIAANVASTDRFSATIFLLITATLFLVQLVFLALGALFSVVIPKIRSVITVTLPTIFTFFIIGSLGAIIGNESVRYITPFKFYDTTYIINNGRYEVPYVVIEAIFVIVAISVTYIVYSRRDIKAGS